MLILSGDITIAHALHEHPTDVFPADKNVIWKPGRWQALAYHTRQFFGHVSQEYEHVIYIAGNHEGYHGRYPDFYQWLRDAAAGYSNIHFLDMDEITIDDITFVGGTLWTDMNKRDPTTIQLITGMMNDFRLILNTEQQYRKFLPQDAILHHSDTVHYIRSVVDSDPNKKYVVVGHHTPTPLSVNQAYSNDYYMNGGYHSDLSEFIMDRPQIKLWTCGHTHFPHTYYMGETLVACNPRGYSGHDPNADSFKLKYIDLDNMPAKFDGVNWSRD